MPPFLMKPETINPFINPSVEVVCPGERYKRLRRLLDVRLLDVGIGLLAPLQQGIAAQGRDHSHSDGPSVATSSASSPRLA